MNTPSNTPSIDAREDLKEKLLRLKRPDHRKAAWLFESDLADLIDFIDQYVSERVAERIYVKDNLIAQQRRYINGLEKQVKELQDN